MNDAFTREELVVIAKVLRSDALQDLVGGGEWNLTEDDEITLWDAINKAEEGEDDDETDDDDV